MEEHLIHSINPANPSEILGSVPMSSIEDVHAKAQAARTALPSWSRLPLSERLSILSRLRDQFILHKEKLARLMSLEMGMPVTQSLYTVDRAVAYMNWTIEHAPAHLAPIVTYEDEYEIDEIVFEPHGVAVCIAPWNFPATNFVWAVFQALAAGNTVLFKNSEETQLFAQEIEHLTKEAGIPAGVLNVIYGDGRVAQAMISEQINFISFTGSTRVGEILYRQAAEKFIPIVLELGGSDAGIVFADADIDRILPALYAGRFTNCGQVCQSMKRLIVHHSRFDELVHKLANLLARKKVGDPMDPTTDIGPLVSQKQLETLIKQVNNAVEQGAQLAYSCTTEQQRKGFSYPPALLTGVTRDMQVWREEVFGPVLPIIAFDTYEEAIFLANDSPYGLSASVFTEDKTLAHQASQDLQAGMIKNNLANTGKPQNIFGGYKKSGMGRENGPFGFHDVTQKKMIAREK